MEKIVKIGGQDVRMRVSALIPRLYRFRFNRDMIADMKKLQVSAENFQKTGEFFQDEDFMILENMAYIMAKHADKTVTESVEDWLSGFDGLTDVYTAMPEIFELWAANSVTTSVPVKK